MKPPLKSISVSSWRITIQAVLDTVDHAAPHEREEARNYLLHQSLRGELDKLQGTEYFMPSALALSELAHELFPGQILNLYEPGPVLYPVAMRADFYPPVPVPKPPDDPANAG